VKPVRRVNANVNDLQFSFWIRTAPTTSVTGFSTTMTTWGADRTTWIGLEEDGGSLKMLTSGLDGSGNWNDHYLSQNLTWGAWYKVVGNAQFVNARFSSYVGDHAYVDDITFAAVPEPGTMAAIGPGVAALLRRRKKSA
jgi:hypothetical protein